MKRIRYLLLGGSLITCMLHSAAQDVMGTWNGTMTLDSHWSGITGTTRRHVSLSIKNNIVTGSVTGVDSAIIEGRFLGSSTCAGSGTGELWRVSLNMDGTYDIEGISPKFTCTSIDGSTNEGTIDVQVSSQRIANKNLLSGTHTDQGATQGVGEGYTTVSWNLSRINELELFVIPQQYDDWLPEPGKDEITAGKTMTIDLKIVRSDGGTPTIRAKSFELELTKTSHEPGITLNAPQQVLGDFPDMGLFNPGAGRAVPQMQSLTINCNKCLNATAQIAAFDGGGYTTLTVKAIMEDNSELEGVLNGPGGIHEIPVPKRPASSNIGTAWLDANNNPGDADDDESSPGNNNNGDGFSAYEEYRGVISEGSFKRLDGKNKDLGVWGKQADISLFSDGFEWFKNASSINVVRFINNEIGPDRKLNRNYKTSHIYDQYVLKLERKHVRIGVLGRTEPGPGIPAKITHVKIDYDQIAQRQRKMEQDALREHVTLPFTLEENTAKAVAHEMGHGVNIMHHGNEEIKEIRRTVQPEEPVRIFGVNNNEFQKPYPMEGSVGTKGNQESGDIFCIMNYNPVLDWALSERNGVFYFYLVPLIPLGTIFCTDGDGTDINKKDSAGNNNYFGDATSGFGNCLGQIKLK